MTSFELKGNALTINYNNGQHATYQLSNMQAGTTFELQTEKDPWGDTFSRLTVIKAPAHAEFAHLHRAPDSSCRSWASTPIIIMTSAITCSGDAGDLHGTMAASSPYWRR